MADATYRVIQRDDDSFTVEVTRTGALHRPLPALPPKPKQTPGSHRTSAFGKPQISSERRRIAGTADIEAMFFGIYRRDPSSVRRT